MFVQIPGCGSRNRSECVCLHIWGDMAAGEVSVHGSALEMCVHTALQKCRAMSYSLDVCKHQRVFVVWWTRVCALGILELLLLLLWVLLYSQKGFRETQGCAKTEEKQHQLK